MEKAVKRPYGRRSWQVSRRLENAVLDFTLGDTMRTLRDNGLAKTQWSCRGIEGYLPAIKI